MTTTYHFIVYVESEKMAEDSWEEGRDVLAFALDGEKQLKHG